MLLSGPRNKLLITGHPGSGKTTLIQRLFDSLKDRLRGYLLLGFITQELRSQGYRTGFKIQWLHQRRELILARKSQEALGFPRVGSYEVFLHSIELTIENLQCYKGHSGKKLWIIDEIGKMESLCVKFKDFIYSILESEDPMIASVGLSNDPFLSKVRNCEKGVTVFLEPAYREYLFKRLLVEFTRKGKLLVFEGIDGSGKTTLTKKVADMLRSEGKDVLYLQEPGDTEPGKKLRMYLKGELNLSKEEVLELFLADRRERVEKEILPGLKEGKWIVMDRYYLSTVAYQGAQGFDLKDLMIKNETIAPIPDLVIFLDVAPTEALKRLNIRQHDTSVFEKLEFLDKVYQNYRKILPNFKYAMIEARLDEEQAFHRVEDILHGEFEGAFSQDIM